MTYISSVFINVWLLSNNIQRWKCTVKTCTAYLKINENDDILLSVSDTDHSHDALPEAVINRQIVSNFLKRKGTQELYERPAKLMQFCYFYNHKIVDVPFVHT